MNQPLPAIITPAVLEWAARAAPGARVVGCEVRPLAGGAVARQVEQVTLHLAGGRDQTGAGGHDRLDLVRKDAPALEIAGLRAAQAVRPSTTTHSETAASTRTAAPSGTTAHPETTLPPETSEHPETAIPADATAHAGSTAHPDTSVIPELVAWGTGWLMTPLAPGSALAWGEAVPGSVFDALAAVHARYHGGAGLPAAIPRVTSEWWRALCREWVDPPLSEDAARHPPATIARARALIGRAADAPAVATLLAGLTPTLLHGDVHPGNVIVAGERATLIDWGSCRVGPAALDLANVVTADSAEVARYARAWERHAGRPLPGDAIELGYRWAALQIPVQYLPWTAGHRPTRDVEAALNRIEQAMSDL